MSIPNSPNTRSDAYSSPTNSESKKARSRMIDVQLMADEKIRQEELKKYRKIILLGSADCGKTTILKQLKLLYADGFSKDELQGYKRAANDNVFDSVVSLVNGMKALNFMPYDPSVLIDMSNFEDEHLHPKGSIVPLAIVEAALRIWNDPASQLAYYRRNEFLIQDTADYFIKNAKRLCSDDFVPTPEECLLIRVVTTSVSSTRITLAGKGIDMIDVGGQRSFRFRWAPYLNDQLSTIFFVTSLASYDQILYENRNVSRMEDSVQLFKSVVANKLLKGVTLMVFLNKVDLFEQKLSKSPLEKYYPEFKRTLDQK